MHGFAQIEGDVGAAEQLQQRQGRNRRQRMGLQFQR